MSFRALVSPAECAGAARAAVLDFWTHDHGHKSDGAGMLRMRQEICCRCEATLVLLRPAAAGSLRSKACRRHAHAGRFFEARADAVALPGGAASWPAGDA